METRFLHVLPKANEEFISHCGLKPKNASYIPLHLAQTFPVSPDSTKLSCSLRQRSVCSVLAYCFLNPHKVLVLSLLYLSTLLNLLNLLPFSLYFSTLTLGRMHTVFSQDQRNSIPSPFHPRGMDTSPFYKAKGTRVTEGPSNSQGLQDFPWQIGDSLCIYMYIVPMFTFPSYTYS